MKITMHMETITPESAQLMLATNVHNRRLNQTTVREYARLMTEGLWQLNGDAIRFSSNGTLLDGQHRLAAAVLADLPLTCWIGTGFPIDAQLTMDQHRKRTAGDVLGMNGYPQGNKVAAIVRMIHAWDRGERSIYGFGGGPSRISVAEVLAIAENDEVYLEAAKVSATTELGRMTTSRASGTLFVLASRKAPQQAEQFFSYLSSGANLELGHPALTLRRHWTRLKRDRNQHAAIALNAGVRAWNAYAEGRPINNISWKNPVIPEVSNYKPRPPSVSTEIEAADVGATE